MDVVAMIVAALVGVPLLAVGIAHLLWSLGIMWPIRDSKLLARTVVGTPGVAKMRAKPLTFVTAVLIFAACVVAFSVADPTSGGGGLTALALLVGLAFLARGALGYTSWWARRTPEEPFRSLDRTNYAPLCLALGAGFLVLVVLRLT
jgi:hypothetical protein